MQIIKSFTKLALLIFPFAAAGQSTYLQQGSKEYQFIDRLEIKQQTNTDLNFSTLKPYSRKYMVQEVEFLDSARMGYGDGHRVTDKFKEWTDLNLTSIDEYNMRSLLMNSAEWTTTPRDYFESKKPFLRSFYKAKANFFEVNQKDFFLAVNPVLNVTLAKERDTSNLVFLSSRGVNVRGLIAKKIGFYAMVTDNQERGPANFRAFVEERDALPGVGFYKRFKDSKGYDYFDARGYFTFNVAKYIDFQVGYDKNFIGNGYRSLFLSDFGNSSLFVKLNTKIWKFNYQNLYMELMPQTSVLEAGDELLSRKYAAMHHLSMNVTKWLNVGLFEGIVFGRKDRFDFQYLNPIIFLRHVEGTVGSPDNALAGLDFKANVRHQFQFYGQFVFDEFRLKDIRKNPTSWANKFGFQLGAKYVDAFNVRNLDFQFETNRVRPFTYSHYDTVANYTHYNQPLAHPLGANFQEFIGIMRYQPAPKWYINATVIAYSKGLDSSKAADYGGDIFKPYTSRSGEKFKLGSGLKNNTLNASLLLTFEAKENLFIDFSLHQWNIKTGGISTKNSMVSGGVRVNMWKRNYDF
ncbi:MAG: hypothetical protein WAT19_16345 [Ferruginibacter sp.]